MEFITGLFQGIGGLLALAIAGVITIGILWVVKGNSAQNTHVRYVSIGDNLRTEIGEGKNAYAGPGANTPDPALFAESVAKNVQLAAGYDPERGKLPKMDAAQLEAWIRQDQGRK